MKIQHAKKSLIVGMFWYVFLFYIYYIKKTIIYRMGKYA